MSGWWVLLALGIAAAWWAVVQGRRARGLARLAEPEQVAEGVDPTLHQTVDELERASLIVAVLVGLGVGLLLVAFSGLEPGLALSLGLLVAIVTHLLLTLRARKRRILMEVQLAEALDMTVSGLRAGASPAEALDRAFREAPRLLARHLGDLIDRLRLGEPPVEVFALLERRLPLEGVRLFRFALSAHWEGGGSLAPTLAAVARSTRDRVAVERRVLAQSSEAQWSVFGVLGITYVLAALLGRSDEQRLADFLATDLAGWLLPAAVVLQAVGLVWMARLTRLEV